MIKSHRYNSHHFFSYDGFSVKSDHCLPGDRLAELGWGKLINGVLFTTINNKAGTAGVCASSFLKKHFYLHYLQ